MTERTTLTPLATVSARTFHEPNKVTARLHATIEEARAVAKLVAELGVALVGSQPPETARGEHGFAPSRGLFETISSQTDELDRRFADIRAVIESIKRQI